MTTPDVSDYPTPDGDASPRAVAELLLTQASHDLCALTDPTDTRTLAMLASRAPMYAFAGRLLLALEDVDPTSAATWARLIRLAAEGWGEDLGDVVNDGLDLLGIDPDAVIAEYEALRSQPQERTKGGNHG
jgi:hypothetical protein